MAILSSKLVSIKFPNLQSSPININQMGKPFVITTKSIKYENQPENFTKPNVKTDWINNKREDFTLERGKTLFHLAAEKGDSATFTKLFESDVKDDFGNGIWYYLEQGVRRDGAEKKEDYIKIIEFLLEKVPVGNMYKDEGSAQRIFEKLAKKPEPAISPMKKFIDFLGNKGSGLFQSLKKFCGQQIDSVHKNLFDQNAKLKLLNLKKVEMGKPFRIEEKDIKYYDSLKDHTNPVKKLMLFISKTGGDILQWFKTLYKNSSEVLKNFWHEHCEHYFKYSKDCEEKRAEEKSLKEQKAGLDKSGSDVAITKDVVDGSELNVLNKSERDLLEGLKNFSRDFTSNISKGLEEYVKLCSQYPEYYPEFNQPGWNPSVMGSGEYAPEGIKIKDLDIVVPF